MADGEIEALLSEGGQAIGQVQLDPDLRTAVEEGRQGRRDVLAAQGHGCGDPQQAARRAGGLAGLTEAAAEQLQAGFGLLDQAAACLAEPHRARAALDQLLPQLPLQLSDPLAHRGLGQAQALGRLREAAQPGHGHQGLELHPLLLLANRGAGCGRRAGGVRHGVPEGETLQPLVRGLIVHITEQ